MKNKHPEQYKAMQLEVSQQQQFHPQILPLVTQPRRSLMAGNSTSVVSDSDEEESGEDRGEGKQYNNSQPRENQKEIEQGQFLTQNEQIMKSNGQEEKVL